MSPIDRSTSRVQAGVSAVTCSNPSGRNRTLVARAIAAPTEVRQAKVTFSSQSGAGRMTDAIRPESTRWAGTIN